MALAKSEAPEFYPYKLSARCYAGGEGLLLALRMAASKRYLVFPKVRLLDLCRDLDGWNDTAAFNHVSQKHVDFVLCDPQTFRPFSPWS